jgi:drug/metabolite transporter (DMT)-like permease
MVVVSILTGAMALGTESPPHTWLGPDGVIAGSIAYLAVFGTRVAFVIQLAAIRRTSASRTALLLGTAPLWAALSAVGLGGEMLPVRAWCGGGLLVVATLRGRWTTTHRRVG